MNHAPQSALARWYQLTDGPWQFLERLRASQRTDSLAALPLERLLVVREEGILSPLLDPLDLAGTLRDSVTQAETMPVTVATPAAVERLPSWPTSTPGHTTTPGPVAGMPFTPTSPRGPAAPMVPGRVAAFTPAAASRQPPPTPPTLPAGMAMSAEHAWQAWTARLEAHPELRDAWQQPLNPQPVARDQTAAGTPLAAPRPQLPIDAAAVTVAERAPQDSPAGLEPAPRSSFNVLDHMERTLQRLEVSGASAQRTGRRDALPALPGQLHSPEDANAPPPRPPAVQPPTLERTWDPAAAAQAASANTPAPPTAPPPGAVSRGLRRLWELGRHAGPPVEAALVNGARPAEPWLGEPRQSAQTASPGSVVPTTPTLLDEAQFADLLARILRREAERYGIQLEELAP